MKKAMVSSTKVRTCSRHPVPEEATVIMPCVCVCAVERYRDLKLIYM